MQGEDGSPAWCGAGLLSLVPPHSRPPLTCCVWDARSHSLAERAVPPVSPPRRPGTREDWPAKSVVLLGRLPGRAASERPRPVRPCRPAPARREQASLRAMARRPP